MLKILNKTFSYIIFFSSHWCVLLYCFLQCWMITLAASSYVYYLSLFLGFFIDYNESLMVWLTASWLAEEILTFTAALHEHVNMWTKTLDFAAAFSQFVGFLCFFAENDEFVGELDLLAVLTFDTREPKRERWLNKPCDDVTWLV